ncbi:MspA family porin [Gordonia sp. (in: high G+C Gram-positive bacteria)]|uniref:MspA family porin n=1 Tax=Gordonia sp. (in: high G+C Gram-positive bacteria) TaxID=84139 RepID=UPI0039E3B940
MNYTVKSAACAALAATVAATALVLATAPDAHADRRVVLPKTAQRVTMGDGTVVTFERVRENATINPSMGGTPLHRNAWVSGRFVARTSQKVDKIEISPGYLVGCQVNLGGATGNGGGAVDEEGALGAESGANLELGPGQARAFYIVDAEHADDFGNEKHDEKIEYEDTQRASLSYTNQQISLRGCAGYAQARSFATVLVETEEATKTMSFYGRPFSLG